MTQPGAMIMLLALVTICGLSDLYRGRIFNAVTYPAIAAGIAFSLLHLGPEPWSAFGGLSFGFLAFFPLFLGRWMGGGDVKLMAAAGVLAGFPLILYVTFYSVFFGGLAAAVVLIWRGQLLSALGDTTRFLLARLPGGARTERPERKGSMPFGVAICFGTYVALALEFLSRNHQVLR